MRRDNRDVQFAECAEQHANAHQGVTTAKCTPGNSATIINPRCRRLGFHVVTKTEAD